MRKARPFIGALTASILGLFTAYGVAIAQAPSVAPGGPSPREQLAQADAMLERMESSFTNIQRELEAAREARDVVKSLCLSDKLNQMDVAIRSANDRRSALEQASIRGDAELAAHEFTVVDVLRQRTEQLSREASQCIGVDAYYIGESRISVSIDPSIPREDVSVLPDSQLVSAPPICASCVR